MNQDMNGAGVASWRADMYALLSAAYHRPLISDWHEVVRKRAPVGIPPGWEEFAKFLDDLSQQGTAQSDEVLCQDFNDLFMVPGPKYVAPYESVHRDAPIEANGKVSPRTFGPSTQQVIAFYDRVGLGISRKYLELPDYVGLELACMEYLSRREAEYLRSGAGDSALKATALECLFLRDHLVQWLPVLAGRIQQKAETGFFRALAALTEGWIRREVGLPCPEELCARM
ncbi:MAG: molecular chaperone TorD family protein [Planctomycetes bacterium]|nr:molecular chaperone TorD family protein [Planctomycetota bacterium]